jgi:hypothetical protein
MSLHKLPRIAFADIVIEAMPFSAELIAWCDAHPELKQALKVTNPDRFIALGHVTTSYSPSKPEDQVIGFYAYDYMAERFKQDFIVNVGGENMEFVLYTRLPKQDRALYGRYIKDINEFYAIYGNRGDYASTHHPSLEEIVGLNDPILTDRAKRYVPLGTRLKSEGLKSATQDQLRDTLRYIRETKAANGGKAEG